MKSVKLLLVLAFVVVFAAAFLGGCEKAAKIKDAYITEAQTTIDEYTGKIDSLIEKAAMLPSPAKEEAIVKIEMAKAKLEEGKVKLEELKGAEAAKWTGLIGEIKTILGDAATLYNDAVTAVGSM